MSVHQQSVREFTIADTGNGEVTTSSQITLIQVIEEIPDLTNEELESIVNLNVSESIALNQDMSITVIRTA